MVWRTLFKVAAVGLGALFALVLVLSILFAVLGALVGVGLAVFGLVFLTVFVTATLAVGVATVYGAYRLLSRSGGGVEPTSIQVDEQEDPIEQLKRLYAEGELSETEFERRLEHELERDTDAIDRELVRERYR